MSDRSTNGGERLGWPVTDSGQPDDVETCPNCGEPVTLAVVLGPGKAYMYPCGCTVAPPS